MTGLEPNARLDGRFSDPSAGPTPWPETEAALEAAELYWLTTVRGDGRPHITPLTALWTDRAFYFATGEGEQKAHNMTANPQVAITTGSNTWTSGTDVVIEGVAAAVTDAELLQRFADLMRTKYADEWDYRVRGEFLSLDGEHSARLYRVTPAKVLAFAKSPHGQTRYRFG